MPDRVRVLGQRGVGRGLLALQTGERCISATAPWKSASFSPYSFGSGSPSLIQLGLRGAGHRKWTCW
nr:hypothetical protein [Streptomyces sp. GS7]